MKYKSNPQPVPPLPSWIPSPSGVSGITLPDDLTEDEIALAHVQSWPKAGIPDSGAHLDSPVKDTPVHDPLASIVLDASPERAHLPIAVPASPVDSVPADPDDMNERRSEWAENAIREFMGESRTDRGDALSDLLSDFGHWADRNDTSLEAEIQRAAMHYNDETDGEGTQFSFLDASHAAKDAKIREADEILKRCAMWLGKMIADGAHLNSTLPNDCVRTLERVEAFRAALESAS